MKKVLLVLVAVLAGSSAANAASASAATVFQRTGAFAEVVSDGTTLKRQNRIAVNHATGDVYVADIIRDEVVVYRPSGTGATEVAAFGSGQVTDPFGLAIDQDTGDVFVSDDDDVVKYDGDNTTTPTFTLDGGFTSPGLTGPLAFDQANDRLLVADTTANTVKRYTATGSAGGSFDGSAGAGSPGAFTGLQDLAVDSTGDVVVVDSTGNPAAGTGTSRVERHAANGDWKATIGPLAGAATVGVIPDSREVIVSGNQDSVDRNEKPTLHRYSATGTDLGPVEIDGSVIYSTVSGVAAGEGTEPAVYVGTDVSAGSGAYAGQYGRTSVQAYTARDATPAVVTGGAPVIRADRAVVVGTVTANGIPTTYYFEYGESTAYGSSSPSTEDADAGAATGPVSRSRTLMGLKPNTTYHYRIVASNGSGTAEGDDRTFTTPGDPTNDGGRVYEQVSPADKGGYPVYSPIGSRLGVTAVSPDGQKAVFTSFGTFAGRPRGAPSSYRSVRTPTGWETRSVSPLPVVPPAVPFHGRLWWTTATPDLTTGLLNTDDPFDPSDTNYNQADSAQGADDYRVGPDNSVDLRSATPGGAAGRVPGGGLAEIGSQIAPDGQSTLFRTSNHILPEDADRPDGYYGVYTRVGSTTRYASKLPAAQQAEACDGALPASDTPPAGTATGGGARSLSVDGSRVLFTVPVTRSGFCFSGISDALFMRIGDERTVELSASRRTQPTGVVFPSNAFLDAAPDLSVVYFRSQEQLTDDAIGAGLQVYEFRPGATAAQDSLRALPPELGDSGRAMVSNDGSQVFLLAGSPSGGGDDFNLRRLTTGGSEQVATLIDGAEGIFDFAMNDDGSALTFATTANATDFDSGGKREVYLWREGRGVECVSCPAGAATADASLPDGQGYVGLGRKWAGGLSEDGARVMFNTAEALVPGDTNNRVDAYEWHDGRASLVSAGTGPQDSLGLGLSRDGRDAHFLTSDSLVSADVDGGDLDVYDARIGGGFPAAGGAGEPNCISDDCQGQRIPPGAPAVPVSLVGPGDPKATKRPAVSIGGLSAAQRRALARSGRVTVTARVNKAGTVRVRARARLSGRVRTVASGSRRASKAGRVRIALRLSRQVRLALARGRAVRVVFEARFGGADVSARAVSVKRSKPPRKAKRARASGLDRALLSDGASRSANGEGR